MKIRSATLADHEAIVDFNQAMAMETEGKELKSEVISAGVRRVLETADRGFYLIAEDKEGIVGSLMVTFEWSDWRNGFFWWIQSVYVVPRARRTGVYAAMYQKVKALSLESKENVCGYRLYVEKENLIAQKTYQKLGMHECEYFMYEAGK